MTEHSSEQSLALLDAEMIFGEADAKMRALFREFRPHGFLQLAYDYVDDNDNHQLVALISDSGIDRGRAEFLVRTSTDNFSLGVYRTAESSNALHMETEVRHYDERAKKYQAATEDERLRLADALSHLDAEKVSTNIRGVIAEQKKTRRRWLGRLTHKSE
jgi:hypothetical protein